MTDDVRRAAQEEAERTYKGFLTFIKYLSYGFVALIIFAAMNNFGVDGTGSKSDPELYEEYKQRMLEMGKEYG
tara:strand:+ start:218 stop:436 length:219 start_codon:yes stop_codon:yes gene_type:complete